jgi:exonuclease SbcD
MIRILHTADWHLGQTFFGYDRTQEHEHFLDWLAGVLTKNKIDVLIVAGDVFDVSNPSAASQRMFYRFIYLFVAIACFVDRYSDCKFCPFFQFTSYTNRSFVQFDKTFS